MENIVRYSARKTIIKGHLPMKLLPLKMTENQVTFAYNHHLFVLNSISSNFSSTE